jgi:hypothetical protein
LNRAMRELESVARSYGDLSEWSRSTLINFADVLLPSVREKRSALALQWKAVTDLFSDLLTSKLNVVQAMAMVMPMEGFALLAMLDRAKGQIVSGLPPINEKVLGFEYDARRFIERVHAAEAQFPSHAVLASMESSKAAEGV